MNVETPAAAPAAPRASSGSSAGSGLGSYGPIALGLTGFLVLWQIILMGVAGRTLDRINDLVNFNNRFFFIGK